MLENVWISTSLKKTLYSINTINNKVIQQYLSINR